MLPLELYSWPLARLADAFAALAAHSDLPGREVVLPPKPLQWSEATIGRWTRSAAGVLNLSSQEVPLTCGDLEAFFRRGAPAILVLLRGEALSGGSARILIMVRSSRKKVVLLAEDETELTFSHGELAQMVIGQLLPPENFAQNLLGGDPKLARQLDTLMEKERWNSTFAGLAVLLELPPTRSLRIQGVQLGITRDAVATLVALILRYAITIAAWLSLSVVSLRGLVDRGRVDAWAILLLGTAPMELVIAWGAGSLALKAGTLIKQRLLEGTFRLPIHQLRAEGVGSAVAVMHDSTILETSAVYAIEGLGAFLDVASAIFVIAWGPARWAQGVIFLGILAYGVWLTKHFIECTVQSSSIRGSLTAELVDRLIGIRTRLVQEPMERWHEGEDEVLAAYSISNRNADYYRTAVAALPRLWLALGTLPTLVLFSSGVSVSSIVSGLAGVVLGQAALTTCSRLVPNLGYTFAAHARLKPLLDAGHAESVLDNETYADNSGYNEIGPIIQAVDLDFEHRVGGRKILRNISITFEEGDRVLLEGPSGGGKSTLASLLAGLRRPTDGLLIVRGLDQYTIQGADWRRVVASAPQFHENYVFSNTLAFNLLGGSRWPAPPWEIAEAEDVCRELGLGELLDQMPSGIHQYVGMTGWQLSHGERSRVFLARALLQGAPLVILDESFGPLDPETLEIAAQCVLRRAKALLVVAQR